MAEKTYDKIGNYIIPEIFTPYLQQKTVENCKFLQSGIASADPGIVVTKGGRTINLPHNAVLSGADEIISLTKGVTINDLDTFADVAVIHGRAVGYRWNNFEAILAQNDPAMAIATELGKNWAVNIEDLLIATLNGVFSAETMADSLNDQSAATLTEDIMVDSMFLLGDNFEKITAIAMHSMVLAKLRKLDLLDKNVMPSTLASPAIPTFMGKTIIVDDKLTATDGVYPVYFFGQGAIAFNENPEYSTVKTDEDIETDYVEVVSRRLFTMHPRGVEWIGTSAGTTPTNTELATGTNWKLVDNRKNVAITKLLVKVA